MLLHKPPSGKNFAYVGSEEESWTQKLSHSRGVADEADKSHKRGAAREPATLALSDKSQPTIEFKDPASGKAAALAGKLAEDPALAQPPSVTQLPQKERSTEAPGADKMILIEEGGDIEAAVE